MLLHAGKELHATRFLNELPRIVGLSTLHLSLRLPGGGKRARTSSGSDMPQFIVKPTVVATDPLCFQETSALEVINLANFVSGLQVPELEELAE